MTTVPFLSSLSFDALEFLINEILISIIEMSFTDSFIGKMDG